MNDSISNGKRIKIAPSILASDFSQLANEIEAAEAGGADLIHVDVMDGHFVPNISIGPVICQAIRKNISTIMDVHLMISQPDNYIEAFARSGADIITIHAEASNHPDRSVELIRSFGCKAGIALNPATSETVIDYLLAKLDLVLVMTVNPGFGGQSFISEQCRKIAAIKSMIAELAPDKDIDIEVDGGIVPSTAAMAAAAGANILVAGSSVFHGQSQDYGANITALRQAANLAANA